MKKNSMFYFDETIQNYEENYFWDNALTYLEEKYMEKSSIVVLNSLVGFSWYYLIEGPIESKQYENDKNNLALVTWKKYIDVGAQIAYNDSCFNFIAGYTLSMNGFIIGSEYEKKGPVFMNNCYQSSDDLLLKSVANNFLINQNSKKYIPLENSESVCNHLFGGDSLLEKYFKELYSD